jgi:ABC-type transport system involved in multi-copper enzyme maturation permease subunit
MFSAMVNNGIGPIIGAMLIIIIGYLVKAIPLDFFDRIEPFMIVSYFDVWLDAFRDPIPWSDIWNKLTILSLFSASFYGIAVYVFLKKDITS